MPATLPISDPAKETSARRLAAKSLHALQKARADTPGYDSAAVRKQLTDATITAFGRPPYEWQLDVAEAILLGLDTIVLAGTGAGKTLPFVMPVLVREDKMVIIISPLIALEDDQVERFRKMGVSAVAVNKDTYNDSLHEAIAKKEFKVILTSPEMMLEHERFRPLMVDAEFAKDVLCVVIDEAHMISQWGDGFREAYGKIAIIRAFFPKRVAFLAATATAPSPVLRDIIEKGLYNVNALFTVNLGNDRPNITQTVRPMVSAPGKPLMSNLDFLIPTADATLKRTLVFIRGRADTQLICRYLRSRLPTSRRHEIAYYHALRSTRAKKKIMRKFRKGKIRILVTTEAAGMGCDIPGIELVVDYMVPNSPSIWVQHAGRAGRSTTCAVEAVLLVEPSVYQTVNPKKKTKKKKGSDEDGAEEAEGEEEEDEDGEDWDDEEVGVDIDEARAAQNQGAEVLETTETVWRKQVDPDLRAYILGTTCRRAMLDEYFQNPLPRAAPTAACCDLCVAAAAPETLNATAADALVTPETPRRQRVSPRTTPVSSRRRARRSPRSTHVSPAQVANAQRKRKLVEGPGDRRGEKRKGAVDALEKWRRETWEEDFEFALFGPQGVLPDKILSKIATVARIRSVEDFSTHLTQPWPLMHVYGERVLEVLRTSDAEYQVAHARHLAQAREARRAQKSGQQAPPADIGAVQGGSPEPPRKRRALAENVLPMQYSNHTLAPRRGAHDENAHAMEVDEEEPQVRRPSFLPRSPSPFG